MLDTYVVDTLKQYKLKTVKNSEHNLLNIDKLGEDRLSLDVIYKDKYKYIVGILRDNITSESWLVDYTSIRELTKHGYICNLTFIEDGNTIANHTNKIDMNGYKAFELAQLADNVDYLCDVYGRVIIVDDKLKSVGRLRHKIVGVCFNIDGKITHFIVHTPLCENIMTEKEFKHLLPKKRDKGRFCINKTAKNAPLAHNYISIEHEHYDKMVETLDDKYLGCIKITKDDKARNIINYAKLNYKVAKVIFSNQAVVALPIPNKFKSKLDFRNALYETEIDTEKFVLYNYSKLDLENIGSFLLSCYESIKNYDRHKIIEYVHKYEQESILMDKHVELKNESTELKDDGIEVDTLSNVAYVTATGDIRLIIRYNRDTDTKCIVLIRDNYTDKEIIIPGSEASYKDYLHGNIDMKKIKYSINTILKDFNKSRRLEDIITELNLAEK